MTNTVTLTDHSTSHEGLEAVQLARLITLKSALSLELKTSMRMSRNMTALAVAKLLTGLKTNDRTKQLAKVEEMIEAQRAKVTYVDHRTVQS